MIALAKSEDQDDLMGLQSTYGALFFGVPNQGMDVEAMATMIGDRPGRYTLNLLDQQLGYRLRSRQHDEFCQAFSFRDSHIVQFFELHKTPTVREVRLPRWLIVLLQPLTKFARTPIQRNGLRLVNLNFWSTLPLRLVQEAGRREMTIMYPCRAITQT